MTDETPIPVRRRGRPPKAIRRRAGLTLRIRDEIKERLQIEAAQNRRSVSEEAEKRIESSFAPPDPLLTPDMRRRALLLGLAFEQGGEAEVVRELLDGDWPDQAERKRRLRAIAIAILDQSHWRFAKYGADDVETSTTKMAQDITITQHR